MTWVTIPVVYSDGQILTASQLNSVNTAIAGGTVGVPNGGTGLTAGVSGGIPYFPSTSTMGTSTLLTANGVMIGGGSGAPPTTTAAGAATVVLHGGSPPTFGAVVLTTDVSGTLPIANGGTASATAAAALAALGAAGSLFRQVNTPTAISNSIAESNLFSTTIAANTLSTNKMVHLTAWGEYLNNRGGNTVYTFRLYYGTTVVAQGAFTMATSANIAGWQIQAELAGGNATNAQKARARIVMTDATAGAANAGVARASAAGTDKTGSHDSIAEDSTTGLTYKLTVQMDTADPASTITITNAQAVLV